MRKDRPQYDAMKEKHIDDMIQLALEAIDAEEAEQIEETTFDHEDEESYKAAFASFLNKLEKEEKENERQNKTESRNGRLRIAAEIAAGIVIAAGLAGTYAIVNVEAVRVRVMQLLIDIQNDHTELEFVEDIQSTFIVPEGWKGLYYPSYIPDGFELQELGQFVYDADYVNAEGKEFLFTEMGEETSTDLDSEDGRLSYVLIGGRSGFCIEKGKWVTLTWSTDDRYFVLESTLPKEESIKIAESVKRIIR